MKTFSGRFKSSVRKIQAQAAHLAVFLVFTLGFWVPTARPTVQQEMNQGNLVPCTAAYIALYPPAASWPEQQRLVEKEVLMDLLSAGISLDAIHAETCAADQASISQIGFEQIANGSQAAALQPSDPVHSAPTDACQAYEELKSSGETDRFFLKDLLGECRGQ